MLWVDIVIAVVGASVGVAATLLGVKLVNRHATREGLRAEAREVLRPGLHSLRIARDMLPRTTPRMLSDEAQRKRENEALQDDWEGIRRSLQIFEVEHPDPEVRGRLQKLIDQLYTCVGDRVLMAGDPEEIFNRRYDGAMQRLHEAEAETEALLADTQTRLGIAAGEAEAEAAD